MTDTEVALGRWYPLAPPYLAGETIDQYTNRLTGADRTGRRPYDHGRNRQCSIGWHLECSDKNHRGVIDKSDGCGCPCHEWRLFAAPRVSWWNEKVGVGDLVTFIEGSDEPPVVTTGLAYIDRDGLPMVPLDTFPDPVELSWLVQPWLIKS